MAERPIASMLTDEQIKRLNADDLAQLKERLRDDRICWAPQCRQVEESLVREVERLRYLLSVPAPAEVKYKLRFGGAIGTDHTNGCFICGAQDYSQRNITGFVDSPAEGYHAALWFGEAGARLALRDWEPAWLQLKIGTCDNHEDALHQLVVLIREADYYLKPQMVEQVRARHVALNANREETDG